MIDQHSVSHKFNLSWNSEVTFSKLESPIIAPNIKHERIYNVPYIAQLISAEQGTVR